MEAFDDDFGELYADVEVQTTAAANGMSDFTRLYLEPEEEDDTKPDSAKLDNDFVADANTVDSVSGESTHYGSENSGPCSGKTVDGGVGSDSEDDLNIVLNDEDCEGFNVGGVRNGGVVTGVACGEDDDDDDWGKNGKCGDQVVDGLELVSSSSNRLAGQNGDGVKVAYSSQIFRHKYVRTQGSTFLNNKKLSKIGALSSNCSPLTNGRWNCNPCAYNQTAFLAANPMVVQCGYGLFLPRHWSIFGVNIDTLEEKPWRIAGVDLTDYFNFGFDENSWKQYCESLGVFQKAMREQIHQDVSENRPSPSSESEVPKGKAIQVEDSSGERQSSMDVRHPRSRNRDSDVVIEIKLKSPSDCSGSGNHNVHEPSEDAEFSSNNNRNIVSSGGEHCNALFEEHSEEFKKSDDSAVRERNDLIPSVDKDIDYQYRTVQPLEDTAEASKGEIHVEKGVGIDSYSADPCLFEAELSLGDQELSLTSYSDSDSEATENSVHVKHEKHHSPPRRRSLNSVTKSKESTLSFQKNLKDHRNSVNMDYYSRNEGQIRKEQRHRSGRLEHGSKLNKLIEHDNDVSPIHISRARDLPVLDLELIDYDRQKERPRGFDCSKRRNVSYYKEAEQSCHYGRANVTDDLANIVHTKYSYRKGCDSLRENINRHPIRNWDESEYVSEQRTLLGDNEDSERDWYEANARYSADDLSPPLSYRESRQFLSKHFGFPSKERDIERRRMHGNPYFRHRNCGNNHWFDECEHEFVNNSHRMSISVTQRGNRHDKQFPHVDGALKRAARKGRHHDRDLDSFWSVRKEDECQKYTHHGTSNCRYYRESFTDSLRNYVYDPKTNENFVRHGRHKSIRDDRGCDWYYGYGDDAEDEDYIIDPLKECDLGRRRYSSPSEVLHWTKDGVIHRHHHDVDAEMETFPYEETSRYERSHARYECLHDEVQIEDVQIQQHQRDMSRRGSDSFIKRSSKIVYRGKRGQASLSCRNSVDLVDEEGKSQGRSSRARQLIYNSRLENLDEGIAKKGRALLKFDESQKKAIRSDISKSKVEYNKRKWFHNIPDVGHKEGLDIEEGQIVTEELCTEASVTQRDVSERATLTGCVKKRMLQNKNNSDQDKNKGGYDNHRILETLAKMEKRRERFKEPIAMKKEAEDSSKLNGDLVLDTDEIKQHRPARKRRWGGS